MLLGSGLDTRQKGPDDLSALVSGEIDLPTRSGIESNHTEPRRRKLPLWTLSARSKRQKSPAMLANSGIASANFRLMPVRPWELQSSFGSDGSSFPNRVGKSRAPCT